MLASKLVRILAIAVAGLVTLAPMAARADQREDLQLKGEEQAKGGRFADAVESFKAADRIERRASHACLIALAYTRRELWSQAQLWLSKCQDRASASDPMPDWSPLVEKQIAERLETSNVAAVTIVVKPAHVKANVTVSSFAPDEVFEPRTIHLAPGTHVVFARAEGFPDRQQTLELRDKGPQTVTIDYSDFVKPPPPLPPVGGDTTLPASPRDQATPSNGTSTALLIAGGSALVVGGISHLLMGHARRDMTNAVQTYNNSAKSTGDKDDADRDYAAAEKRYDRWRPIAIGMYVVGAGLAVTGYLIRKKTGSETTVSATPLLEGGGFVSVGWMR